jgi:hypothetical protein
METSRNLEPSFEVSTSWESSAVLLWLLTKMSKATNDRCAQHNKTHSIVGHHLGLRRKLTRQWIARECGKYGSERTFMSVSCFGSSNLGAEPATDFVMMGGPYSYNSTATKLLP